MRNREVNLARLDDTGRFALEPGNPLAAAPWLLYDGECPFCSAYSRFARISAALPGLRLLNAHEAGPELDLVKGLGLDLDEGMVLQDGGTLYYGRACMHRLSQLAAKRRLPNQVIGAMTGPGPAGEMVYKALVRLRQATLFLLGRKRL